MHELTDYSDDGIRLWVAEQEGHVNRISARDPQYRNAVLIKHYLEGIKELLKRPAPPIATRRHELLTAMISQWRADNPRKEPPYQKLTMHAAQEAMRESRADIADLATEIAKLRDESRAANRKTET
jgi:hypothetical protein